MIKNLINRILEKAGVQKAVSKKTSLGKRVDIAFDDHRIDLARVDDRALHVVRGLQDAGFEAYIVGGAVRDLLVGLTPKDFDVATNATPEEVKSLFRRAFIIGRRFRIVHVVYGRGREHEVIEVSTFRAYLDNGAGSGTVQGNEKTTKHALASMTHAVDSNGRVLRDNVWGPMIEDAARRDFTINAMYYDPRSQTVVDFHGGLKDVRDRRLRLIGDPATRYREDPVRIIRAVRFSAKLAQLGFSLDAKTAKPLLPALPLVADVPQSRLFDEMLKLLQTGHALASVQQLVALGISQGIYPLLDLVVDRRDDPLVHAALVDTDRRLGEGKPVAPSFLLACVLWSDVRSAWNERLAQRMHPFPALQDAIDQTFNARIGDVSGRGKLAGDMREIWLMQPRFEKRAGVTPFGLIEQPRFRAGFDFLRLRADANEVDISLADWWQEFSMGDDAVRRDLVEQMRLEQTARSRSSRVGRVHRLPVAGDGAEGVALQAVDRADGDGTHSLSTAVDGRSDGGAERDESSASPTKKRRRRRRKPGSGEDSSSGHSGQDGQAVD
jgi:poly(A) polymerase